MAGYGAMSADGVPVREASWRLLCALALHTPRLDGTASNLSGFQRESKRKPTLFFGGGLFSIRQTHFFRGPVLT